MSDHDKQELIPQRGIFAIGRAFFKQFAEERLVSVPSQTDVA